MKIANVPSIAIVAATAAAGVLSVASLQASAAPANGVAIANIVQQVDTVIVAKSKKKKGRCPADQKRDRAGYCVPNANL